MRFISLSLSSHTYKKHKQKEFKKYNKQEMFQSGMRASTTVSVSAQELDNAKAVARKMFEMYDRDRSSSIENYELPVMMQDTYKVMNRSFNPTPNDVEGYARVLDRNGDGRVTYADIEALCIRYLVGEQFNITSQSQVVTLQPQPQVVTRIVESEKRSGAPPQQLKASGQPMQLTSTASRLLEQARRLFEKYDTDRSGYIDPNEMKSLLEDTYRGIGVQKTFLKDDVDAFYRMADMNQDGLISLKEYEDIVIKSLERAGIAWQ
jgi:Ca2+-binding EF-hand superfamily protein